MGEHTEKRQDARRGASYKMKEYREAIDLLQRKEIPETWPEVISTKALTVRNEIIGYCGYCLLAYDWLRPLATWIGDRSCLEIMCGSGALAKGLQNCGVSIVATDDHSWDKDHAVSWFVDAWTDIEQLNALDAIETYRSSVDIVICSWPFRSEDCYHALLKLREVNPNAIMLYIGEWHGGATASDTFFDAARCLHDDAFEEAVQHFASVHGMQDKPRLIQ